VFELGEVELERGGRLQGARLLYKTHGTLNEARSNAILYPHMYASTPSSLESTIAVGRALDPERWFIVCPGMLGGGFSSSPSNTTGEFPELTIGDDVLVQHRLVTEVLGIERLALVVGFSMGAQQAYEWAVRFPDLVDRLAAVAGTARTTPANELQVRLAEQTLGGGGLALHALAWATCGLSDALFRTEGWREAGFTSVDDLAQRLFVDDFTAQDARNLASLCRKWQRADVSRHTNGDLDAALSRITARTVVMPCSHDRVFPVEDCATQAALIAGATIHVIESPWGHWAWEMTEPWRTQFDGALRELLAP
jgi:homoserine O-acetyltransferase/O-succinyltransferase